MPSLLPFLFLLTSSRALTVDPPANITQATAPFDPNLLTSSSAENTSGVNCRGSLYCLLYAGHFVNTAYHISITGLSHPLPDWDPGPLNSSALYAATHHILCLPFDESLYKGFCVFAQSMKGEEPYVNGAEVKRGLGMLVEYGCRMCGSVPLEVLGMGEGWLTVNYVSERVCGGVCPEARYQ
ncbi:MAG: hypothetical protein Q9201_002826 [Fulgogasparrea decipioides]